MDAGEQGIGRLDEARAVVDYQAAQSHRPSMAARHLSAHGS